MGGTAALAPTPAAAAAAAAAASAAEEEDDEFLYGGGGKSATAATTAPAVAAASAAGSKRTRTEAFGATATAAVSDDAQAAAATVGPPAAPRPLRLLPIDALVSAAPGVDAVIGRCGGFLDEDSSGAAPSVAPYAELATACGVGHTGGLVLAGSALHALPADAGVRRLPEAFESAWCLPQCAAALAASGEDASAGEPQPAEAAGGGGFALLGTRTGRTRVLRIDPVTGALFDAPSAGGDGGPGFACDCRTLAAGCVLQPGTRLPPAEQEEGGEARGVWREHDGTNARFVQASVKLGG